MIVYFREVLQRSFVCDCHRTFNNLRGLLSAKPSGFCIVHWIMSVICIWNMIKKNKLRGLDSTELSIIIMLDEST